jgi:ferrochelatase
MNDHTPDNHPSINYGKIGVLIINLGTPEATDYWSVRRYLKEFLSDRRVVDTNRYLWWFILNFIILSFRPSKSARAYKAIWNKKDNESPLKTYTRSQSNLLKAKFKKHQISIDWAMRYGKPSIYEKLNQFKNSGIDRVLIFPLYPQYSAATTASVQDEVFSVMKKMRWQPSIRTVPPYFDNPLYINALAESIQKNIDDLKWSPDILLTSYHGLPKRYLTLGDPYHCHCYKTTRLLREKITWFDKEIMLTFQSRFGPEEWLQPYTENTVVDLAKSGVKNLAMISPAFISDCVETLEELDIGIKEKFYEHGGKNFTLIPCMNHSDIAISMLKDITLNELKGWI